MDNEIDIMQLLGKIWKRKWMIIAITTSFMLIAGAASLFLLQPLYEANVNIIIGKEEARYFFEDRYTSSDINLYLQVIKTYEEIAKSRTVRYRVEDSLQDSDFHAVKNIKVSSKTGTQIINISVSHPSAHKVASYANALAEHFIQVANEVLPAGELKILDYAEKPNAPISPNHKMNIALAFVLGGMISIGIIILMEYFNQYIETEYDVEKYLDLPVLCVFSQDQFVLGEHYGV